MDLIYAGETTETRAFEDRHGSAAVYIDYMGPRCVELARSLKKTASFYCHCDWLARQRARQMAQADPGPKRRRRAPGAQGLHSALRYEVTQ